MADKVTRSARNVSIVALLIGAWLIVAPFAMVYADGIAYLNQIAFCLLVVGLAVWQLDPSYAPTRRSGGHHGARPAH